MSNPGGAMNKESKRMSSRERYFVEEDVYDNKTMSLHRANRLVNV